MAERMSDQATTSTIPGAEQNSWGRRSSPVRKWYLVFLVLPTMTMLDAAISRYDPVSRHVFAGTNDYSAAIFRWRNAGGERNSERSELFIAGNSTAREGLDQRLLTELLGIPCYNFGLSSIPLSEIAHVVKLLGKNDILLLCVNDFILDDRARKDPRLPWNIDSSLPYVIGHQTELSQLFISRFRGLIRRALRRTADAITEGSRSRQYRYRRRLPAPKLEQLRVSISDLYVDDGVDHTAVSFKELDRLCARAKSGDFKVVLLAMPDEQSYPFESLMGNRIERAMELASARGLLAINTNSLQLASVDFHDYNHLLTSGRDKLTRFAAKILGESLSNNESENTRKI
jgi:hypothetical protein